LDTEQKPDANDIPLVPEPASTEASPDVLPEGPDREKRPATRRNVIAAVFLSFLWPGLGHLLLKRRKAAALFAVPAFAVALLAIWQIVMDPLVFTASLADDSYFAAFDLIVIAFALWRVAAIAHALWIERRAVGRRFVESGVAVFLIVCIAATHGLVAYAAWTVYDTTVAIQNNDFLDQAMGSPGASATATASPTATPTKPPQPTFASGVAEPTYPITSARTAVPNPNRITFLLIGVDFETGRSTGSTDTLMVVSVDTQTRAASIVSVPRDTAGFQLYWGPWVASNFKINGLLASVYRGATKSPDPPMTTLEKEVSFLVGIPINYYAAIDMDGFARMVDAMGGVDIYNVRAINDDVARITLPAGPAHLDGNMALRYVRSRENGGSDYLRSSRQQQVLLSLEHKVVSAYGIAHFTTLMSLAGKIIQTDFPLKDAKDYVKLGQTLSDTKQCVLSPPYSWHPDNSTTHGFWTSRLDLTQVASLSVSLYGQDSAYYGQVGITPKPCQT